MFGELWVWNMVYFEGIINGLLFMVIVVVVFYLKLSVCFNILFFYLSFVFVWFFMLLVIVNVWFGMCGFEWGGGCFGVSFVNDVIFFLGWLVMIGVYIVFVFLIYGVWSYYWSLFEDVV